MPSKQTVLKLLSRDELLGVVDRFDLAVSDRRVKDGLVEAVAASKKATLADVLTELSRDRLKEMCRALDLDASGREKAARVERLAGTKAIGETKKLTNGVADPTVNGSRGSAPPPGEPVDLTRGERLSITQFERYFWSAADILRGSIDSSAPNEPRLPVQRNRHSCEGLDFRDRAKRGVRGRADDRADSATMRSKVLWDPSVGYQRRPRAARRGRLERGG